MSKYIPGNQKHLTLEDREYIKKSLDSGITFKDIAKYLCKDPTTISKEIKLHRLDEWYRRGPFYNKKNFCEKRFRCNKLNACDKIILCGVKCTSCPTCNQACKDFVREHCNRLDKTPYLCNGCHIISRCTKGAVRLILDKLERQLDTYDFLTLFSTILTNQGTEFGAPDSLEASISGMERASIYYNNPMRSGQKGGIKQAHTMQRMVLPKGTSFEYLTQWNLRTIVDHINSTPRESLNSRTPI